MEPSRVEADGRVGAHYSTLARSYDALWEHTDGFRSWMCDEIEASSGLPPVPAIVDVGGGTGLYSALLLERHPGASAIVVDPSAEMLAQVPRIAGLQTLQASAEETAEHLGVGVAGKIDLVLIKEAIHHVAQPGSTFRDLTTLLSRTGTLLIVMLPTQIEYPLFAAALDRFSQLQPDPALLAEQMEGAGLRVKRSQAAFDLSLPREKWIQMVEGRFMSLLSTFSDAELASGVAEVRKHLGDSSSVRFRDSFEFLIGVRRA